MRTVYVEWLGEIEPAPAPRINEPDAMVFRKRSRTSVLFVGRGMFSNPEMPFLGDFANVPHSVYRVFLIAR